MTKKIIPSRNYLILIGVIILVISACFAFYNLYNIYKDNKSKTSPLANKEVLYEDLKETTKELDADTFLVISFTSDEQIHNNENKIKKYLKNNNLIDNVMYLNVSELMTEQNFLRDLNATLNLAENLEIKKFPALVYYKEGIPTFTIDSKDHLLNKDDFIQVIDMYEIDK